MTVRLIIKDGMVTDDKFIVFKREDFNSWYPTWVEDDPLPDEITDAVVIRTQDIFAGPALHGYAAALGIAIRVLVENDYDVSTLQNIADYFSQRAVEADNGPRKIPD